MTEIDICVQRGNIWKALKWSEFIESLPTELYKRAKLIYFYANKNKLYCPLVERTDGGVMLKWYSIDESKYLTIWLILSCKNFKFSVGEIIDERVEIVELENCYKELGNMMFAWGRFLNGTA